MNLDNFNMAGLAALSHAGQGYHMVYDDHGNKPKAEQAKSNYKTYTPRCSSQPLQHHVSLLDRCLPLKILIGT